MENMAINIHFFRSTQKGRIKFDEVLDYFQELPNFEIFYDQEKVDIIYTDNEFGFQYEFKITKVSQVAAIYKLDPAYLNLNFMLCLPLLIPSYAVKEILAFTQKLCRYFELAVYHEEFDNVKMFNIADVYSLFASCQKRYLLENEESHLNKIFYDSEKLNAVCKYQRTIDNLSECFHGEVVVKLCSPIIDRKNNEFGICAEWNVGIPTLFAPYFDIVNIKDEDGEEFKIRRNDFMKFMGKYLTKVENYLPDMYVLKKKAAKSSKAVLGKLRKYAIIDQLFETLRISDLIDKN